MIKRIILFLFIPSVVIAVFLSLGGVSSIPFDSPDMYSFFKIVARRFDSFVLQIPSIPKVPYLQYMSDNGFWAIVLNVLIFLVRVATFGVNSLSSIINSIGAVVNFLLALLEYALIFIYSLKDLRNGLMSQMNVFIF